MGPNPSVIGDFVRGFDGSERIFKIDVQHGARRVALVKCQWTWTTRSVRGLDPGCSPLKEGKPQSHVGFLWGQCSQGDHEADAWLMVICSHYYTILRIRIVTNIIHNKWQRGKAQEVWAWLRNVDLAHVITSGTRTHASWIASRVPAARTLQPFQLTRAGSSPFKRVWRNYAPWRHKGLQGAPLTCSSWSSRSSTFVSTMSTKCICINTNESVHNIWVTLAICITFKNMI